MFIKSIRLKNYRCYRDCRIELGNTPESNVTIITGHNGAGKSTLFNAIGWCLLGQETQVLLGSKSLLSDEKPIPNESSFDTDDMSHVEVTITLEFSNDLEMYQADITRRATFRKGTTQPVRVYSPDITAVDRFNSQIQVDETTFISTILPKNLATFYLFDAEWLKSYGRNTSIKVSDGIEGLFRLDRFLTLSELLKNISSKYSNRRFHLQKASKKNQDIRERLKDLYGQREVQTSRIHEGEAELSRLTKTKDETESDFNGMADIAKQVEQYNNKKQLRDQATTQIEKLRKDLLTIQIM